MPQIISWKRPVSRCTSACSAESEKSLRKIFKTKFPVNYRTMTKTPLIFPGKIHGNFNSSPLVSLWRKRHLFEKRSKRWRGFPPDGMYMYVHVYVYVCICLFMFVYVCICTYMYVYVCICVCICMHMHACVCICMCMCMYMYVYVCICQRGENRASVLHVFANWHLRSVMYEIVVTSWVGWGGVGC